MPFRPLVLLAAPALAAAVACSGDSTPSVEVTATDTSCTPTPAQARAGKIKFDVENRGSVITEVYLYAPGDRAMGEVENVEPGAKNAFTVDVGGGAYEVACKPGQIGDGVRAPFTVTGPPDSALTASSQVPTRGAPEYAQAVVINDQGFLGLEDVVVAKGQTVTFLVENRSSTPHGLAIVAPDGSMVGETGAIDPGKQGQFAARFTAAGTYRAIDPIGANGQHGFEATVPVVG